jgi:hypothetical protein
MSRPETSAERNWFLRAPYQTLAFLFCFLFAVAMVVNVQLSGDAEWFFYGQMLHHGVKLYAGLHLPLQPFFILETDAWELLFGKTVIAYESISLVHIFLFCLGVQLILRHSNWPDWRKGALFVGAFFSYFYFPGIRFDDFHVGCDICLFFTIVALLRLNRERLPSMEFAWAAMLGILSGICFTTRVTEGAMLVVGTAVCVLFLAPRRKVLATAVYLLTAAVVVLGIVHLTGDTFHDYAAYSIFHAASAKGGTHSILETPFRAIGVTAALIFHNKGWAWFIVLMGAGVLARKRWKDSPRAVITAELLSMVPFVLLLALIRPMRKDLTNAAFIFSFNIIVQNVLYPLCLYVLYRWWRSQRSAAKPGRPTWDKREILIVLVITNLVAVAFSEGVGTSNGTFGLFMLIVFADLWLPLTGRFRWLADSWVAIALVLAASGAVSKIHSPYAWQNYETRPMFEGRVWYHHPLYGPMYIQKDELQFFQPICKVIDQTGPQPELLSMPYSYANYFCGTPPWHGYVQTWFDTTPPDTVHTLMRQLDQAPPQWILYQRQLPVLSIHERFYNHNQPIAHRELDQQIMDKLATGQWKLVERSDYISQDDPRDGWFLIETRP